MNRFSVFKFILAAILILLAVEPALAGPGGKIASAAYESTWGRIILFILVIIMLPTIVYNSIREKISERRARKDLRFMAGHSSIFEWLKIQERAKDCFFRVHSGWREEDLSRVSNWMTGWYWQNQQLVHLERWKEEGLINICNVKMIGAIKPILFVHRNEDGEHEGSMIVLSIIANMQDYLANRNTEEVVEGSKRYKDVETIWSFTLESGVWKVSDIEASDMMSEYLKLTKELPSIESTVISELKA